MRGSEPSESSSWIASANNLGDITLAIHIASDFNPEEVSILEEEIGAKPMVNSDLYSCLPKGTPRSLIAKCLVLLVLKSMTCEVVTRKTNHKLQASFCSLHNI